jgi:hypothetical protein
MATSYQRLFGRYASVETILSVYAIAEMDWCYVAKGGAKVGFGCEKCLETCEGSGDSDLQSVVDSDNEL